MQILCVLFPFVSVVLDGVLSAEEAAIPPFKEQCLKWHNEFRTKHQVDPVTWSDDLTTGAQRWANILVQNNTFEHEKGIQPGENLYLSGKPIPEEPCSEASQLFYGEIKDYNFDKPGFSMKTGHFTQLVWKKTKEIGAAMATRQDGRLVVVVRYNPPGNFNDKYEENVLPELKKSGVGQTRSSLVFTALVVVTGAAFKTFF
ncbi:Golgi-associated plant pathogenesis-related protein 1-like isoform X1 [Oculina patagonica]